MSVSNSFVEKEILELFNIFSRGSLKPKILSNIDGVENGGGGFKRLTLTLLHPPQYLAFLIVLKVRLWLFVQLKFNGVLNGISETAVSEMHYFDRKLIRSTA